MQATPLTAFLAVLLVIGGIYHWCSSVDRELNIRMDMDSLFWDLHKEAEFFAGMYAESCEREKKGWLQSRRYMEMARAERQACVELAAELAKWKPVRGDKGKFVRRET